MRRGGWGNMSQQNENMEDIIFNYIPSSKVLREEEVL